jgi:hypothetical protein
MKRFTASAVALSSLLWLHTAQAQLIDKTQQPNTANEGIAKSLTDEIGAGRGDWTTPNSWFIRTFDEGRTLTFFL